jgi:hypothetical protein
MASSKVKRRRATATVRTEFPITLEKILQDLLDPGDVEPEDKFSFVDASTDGLIICRDRVTTELFDENGDPIGDLGPGNSALSRKTNK